MRFTPNVNHETLDASLPQPPPYAAASRNPNLPAAKNYESSSDDSDDSSLLACPNPEDTIPPVKQVVYDVAHAARRTRDIEDQVRYVNERAELQGTEVVTRNKSASPVTWTVTDVEDSTKIINQEEEDPQEIGLTGFDFRRFEMSDRAGRPNRRINFMKLLFALWPGNVHHQLLVLNGRIEEDNKGRESKEQGLTNFSP